MVHLCTFFDIRYLDRGLALHRSLVQQGAPFHLWVLCMDDDTRDALSHLGLSDVTLVTTDDLAGHDPAIRTARGNRSLVEFYFTSKSFLCLFILAREPAVDLLTYLDADTFFFGSPETIRAVMEGCSIGLTPHRFPPHLKQSERYGRFNAGFLSIRRDEEGLKCLTWWRDSCFAWCHDHVHEGRFADQGYLDRIPELFRQVRIIDHKGINAAPWNISQYRTERGNGPVLIDGDPLVLYHFHGLRRLSPAWFESGVAGYQGRLSGTARKAVYMPYIDTLLRHCLPGPAVRPNGSIRITQGRYDGLKRFFPFLWRSTTLLKDLWRGVRYRSLIRYRPRDARTSAESGPACRADRSTL